MTEEQYYASSLDQSLNSTINNGCDFNKYDPYVEKIRTLFVPSLESRIYSCLETFVYPEDHDALLKLPCLKRCLDVAATWRQPVDSISKLEDCGFLERMLAQAVKYLFKDGFIDCFLNSIILNNRLNNVCRNLDAIAVEKDFLKYLAVWNYINEKDYWVEDERNVSMSMSGPSFDSIESYNSDLDVQVGSELDTRRTGRCFNKTSKQRAVDHSSKVLRKNANNFSGNGNKENCSGLQFLSRLNIDSSNLEGSKSNRVRRKPRSISQTCPYRASNCPTYRAKKSQRGDWEGKTLKLRVSKISPSTFDSGLTKPLRLSKLPLPCKFDDVIAEIVKTDLLVPRSSLITTRKKLQAGVTNICRSINDTLGKMSREEVRRCRFHCEILPGFVSFKLVQREPNGCKVCLFTDRVATDKIDGQYTPRGSPINQKAENMRQKNSHEYGLPICESSRVDLSCEDSQIVSSLPINTEANPRVTSSLRLPESRFNATVQQKSNEFVAKESSNCLSGNGVDDSVCSCNPLVVDGLEYSDHKEEKNTGTSRVKDSEMTVDRNNSTESSGKVESNRSTGKPVEDETCYCNNSDDDKLEILNHESEKTPKLSPEASLNRLNENKVEDETCFCSTSLPQTFDINPDSENNQESNCIECLETSVNDFETSNVIEPNVSAVISNSQHIASTGNKKVDSVPSVIENDQQVLMPQLNLNNSSPKIKSTNKIEKNNDRDDVGCECPPNSCECIENYNDEYELEHCDSRCSCDSCDAPDKSTSVNHLSDVARVSPLVNPVQPIKVDAQMPNVEKTILIKKSQYFGTASDVQLQPNCVESLANSWESHNPKNHRDTTVKSKMLFPSNVANIPLLDTEMKGIVPTRNNPKYLKVRTETLSNDQIKESNKKSPLVKSPVRIDTGRISSAKSQRINISIELCPESESSGENNSKNEHGTTLCQNDLPSMRKLRCHSADSRNSRKQATLLSEKNTKDECLRHLRCVNACRHSPPRPLESRDYLPHFEPSSRTGNPIVYGMSTKSSERSTCKFERESMRHHKRGKNGESKYHKFNGNRQCCNKIPEKIQIDKRNELPKQFLRSATTREKKSPSVIHNNLCHAFSASSVDRMKHLIKTKLRRILLERDKATNTPKTTLTNEKYRVSVPNGKTKRLPFARQRCHTIWESRSASDSAHTSRTFDSNDRTSLIGVSQGDETKSLFYSMANSKNLSSEGKYLESSRDFDNANNATCYCLSNSDQSIVSSRITIVPRLIGGSDAPYTKGIDHDFQYLWKQRQKTVRKFTNKEVKCVSNRCNDRLSSKIVNHSCTGDSEVAGNGSAKLSHLVNSADCNGQAILNECQDLIIKYPGKLDWSGNSTSRHIYLYEYNNFESSNDEEERNVCNRKISSPKFNSFSISKQGKEKKNTVKKTQKTHEKSCKEVNSRPYKRQSIRESTIPRSIRAPSFVSSKMHVTNNIRCQKGLGKLDQDLRSKLLQYVSLCKNVKYSLLKMLRPNEIYEVSRTSISCCDRYKFRDS